MISPVGVGVVSRSVAVATARKAWASMAKVGPAVPGAPASDLVLIKPNQAFGCLEGFLDAPALSGHGHQGAQRDGLGAVAAQVGVLTAGVVAPDQQMVGAGVGVVFGQQAKPGPGVQAWSVCPRTGGVLLPGVGRYEQG